MPICYKEEKSVDGKVIKEGKLKMMRSCGGVLAAKSCLTFATPLTAAHQAPLSMGFSMTAAHQAPLSMGFSRQEYRRG